MSLPRSRQQPQRGGQSPPQQLGFDVRRLQSGSQERLETRSVSRAHGLQSGLQGPPQPTQADLLSNRVLQMDIAQQEWCREQQLRQQQRLQEQQQRWAVLHLTVWNCPPLLPPCCGSAAAAAAPAPALRSTSSAICLLLLCP